MLVARAPVRLSFGGGGTDLEAYYAAHGGFVVSAAISRYAYVTARVPGDRSIRINSADYRLWETFEPGVLPPVAEPLSLPKAAIEAFLSAGIRETGIDLFLASEVPPGTGLGSSSAMAVALVHALAATTGGELDAASAAGRACGLEIERLGMPIGKQDQYASAFGGLNAIELTAHGVDVQRLPLGPSLAAALDERLLLFATGHSRQAASILREQQADTRTKPAVLEALHTIKSLAYDMAEALVVGDLDLFGLLLHRGWQEKRRLSSRISSPEIDEWYDAARQAGALGGKIAGAGGGGFLLLYCPPAGQAPVRAAMAERGLRELRFEIDWQGARVLHTSAADIPPEADPVADGVHIKEEHSNA